MHTIEEYKQLTKKIHEKEMIIKSFGSKWHERISVIIKRLKDFGLSGVHLNHFTSTYDMGIVIYEIYKKDEPQFTFRMNGCVEKNKKGLNSITQIRNEIEAINIQIEELEKNAEKVIKNEIKRLNKRLKDLN